MHFRTNNPQWLGARLLWGRTLGEVEISTFGYDIEETLDFVGSPASEIFHGTEEVRRRPGDESTAAHHPFYAQLRAQGITDYVAWPMYHTLGKRHMITFGTDREGGFKNEEIASLREILPVMALVSEIRIKNVLARTILRTYVGARASEAVLAGATRRGAASSLAAAVMIADLRNFTWISDRYSRDEVVALLNEYFEAFCEPIEENGGEVLKFMGDSLLAVFPLEEVDACKRLLRSVIDARNRMALLNVRTRDTPLPFLNYGIGVHVGEVMYGNIGSKSRLDFTVIGPCVNIASRLQQLAKRTCYQIIMSEQYMEMAQCEQVAADLGLQHIDGLGAPLHVYGLRTSPLVDLPS
jgi:adenylate cyclase